MSRVRDHPANVNLRDQDLDTTLEPYHSYILSHGRPETTPGEVHPKPFRAKTVLRSCYLYASRMLGDSFPFSRRVLEVSVSLDGQLPSLSVKHIALSIHIGPLASIHS